MVKREYSNKELITFEEKYKGQEVSLEDKEICLHLDSFCLGDSICFSAFVKPFLEFHKPKKIFVTTFFKHLFVSDDDRIEFLSATEKGVHLKIDKYISVGYHKEDLNHTLGGMFYAVRDTMKLPMGTKPSKCPVVPYEKKTIVNKITIAPESLKMIAKWNYNNEKGWQTVVDELNSMNFEVFNVSYEDNLKLNNVRDFHGFDDINVALNHILESRVFIGLSSGLAWLAWAYDVPVVMIANFTKPHNEFECFRVKNEMSCSGCFNVFKNITSSCPIFLGTQRENECHKTITPDMVMKQVKLALV